MTFANENLDPVLGQTQKCAGIKPGNVIPHIPLW